jgi:aminocarboxymuconate-semialdehyde decarboxylase
MASHAWIVADQGLPSDGSKITQPPSQYMRRFYYDCIVYSEAALRYLIDTVGVDRVVFGTYWACDMVFDWPVSRVSSLESITDEEKELILWKTWNPS